MKVIWTPQAELDRLNIFDFISADNAGAALRMDALFSGAAAMLERFPLRGRPGLIEDTREYVVHRHYRLIYSISDDEVWVLALLHSSRQWPPFEQ